ncbi:MAG: UDP-3-O-(3-hydroxymyristoyl)glucosamine N-acyltransferase [Nitrospira sp.]|nr:UDP-3-O-(3-hydroxymyristoyl)glucosamine N-acyltransferase [bacterium]MBL7048814.1 UDP-3-O-(3-hydroxymyristoyl)glucosamine N-acyltransferase [Nitrospira sp.]
MKLKELAELLGGKVTGNAEVDITGVSSITEALPGEITYISDMKHLKDLQNTGASALMVKTELKDQTIPMVIVDNPQYAFARTLEIFHPVHDMPSGISNAATLGNNTKFGSDVTIMPNVWIGDGVIIGRRTVLYPGTYIGRGTIIGEDSVIHPNVTIRNGVIIGNRVSIHPGSVIGSDGFGYVYENNAHYKIPQVGGVIIEDDVEIGANVTIDRATLGNTVIGSGSKIDNLTQIAHNVNIGKNCIIVSQVGISGSVDIGDGAVLAGQVGVRDHVKIGPGSMIAAQSGVGGNVPGGQIYSGSPAIPHKQWLKSQGIFTRLPDYIKRLIDTEKKLNRKENANDG